jgi:hypothetical protein
MQPFTRPYDVHLCEMCDSRVANMGQPRLPNKKGGDCGPSQVRRANPTTQVPSNRTPTARFSHPSPPATTTSHVIPWGGAAVVLVGGGGGDASRVARANNADTSQTPTEGSSILRHR